MAQVTRLGLYGGPRHRYAGFIAKPAGSTGTPAHITRLGLYGGPRHRYADFVAKTEAPAVTTTTTEPRGSTPYDQRHRRYDFGEHYPGLKQQDKALIDDIISTLTPAAEKRLRNGRPSKSLRKKIARVMPSYAAYTPKPFSEYRTEADLILQQRTEDLIREDEEAMLIILMLAE